MQMEKSQQWYIDGLRKGDKKSFQALFDQWYEPLCRYGIQQTGNPEEAEEIVQDVFVKLWMKREKLSIDTSIKSYLYRMVLNSIINRSQHQKVRMQHKADMVFQQKESESPAHAFAAAEVEMLAMQAIENMPEKRRQVYEFSRVHGLKYSEIAEKMGISVKTVEVHLSKALEQLRFHLKDYLMLLLILLNFIRME